MSDSKQSFISIIPMSFIINQYLYDFLLTYMMGFSLLLALTGLINKIISMIRVSFKLIPADYGIMEKGLTTRSVYTDQSIHKHFTLMERIGLRIKNSIFYKNPFSMLLTVLFHMLVIILPFAIQAHGIVLFQQIRISTVSISDRCSIVLAFAIIIMIVIMLARRILLSHIRMITTWTDFYLLAAVSLPFITGILCYYQYGNYKLLMIVHIMSAQILVILLGWSKMGHVVLFFFSRLFIRNTRAVSPGARGWGRDTSV